MSLNPKFKEEFVAALRSGEFKQSRENCLQSNNGYCCLGVGSVVLSRGEYDLHGCEWGGGGWNNHQGSWYAVIPSEISEPLGLEKETQEKLYGFNDSEGWTFDQIADWIEENL